MKQEKKLSKQYGRDVSIISYFYVVLSFVVILTLYYFLSQFFSTPIVRDVSFINMFFLAIAAHKISWLLTKDAVFTFVRAPFSKFSGFVGPGATTSESPRGEGMRYVIGELLTCSWCINMWAATILVLSYFLFPKVTIAVAMLFAILMLADVVTILYIILGNILTRSYPEK